MTKSERLRNELVKHLRALTAIRSKAIEAAFLAVPRESFIPEAARSEGLEAIYKDVPVPTKSDERGIPVSSSSQPAIMAQMLELLDLAPGHRVLEIGTGTGYNAALLSMLVGPRGRVVTVELDHDLASRARTRLAADGHRARVVVGDGRLGVERAAPFDRIIVTASAVDIPVAWRDQLVEGGVVVVPLRLGGMAQVVAALRRAGQRLVSTAVVSGGFMGLRSAATEPATIDTDDHVNVGWRVGGAQDYRSARGSAIARMTPTSRRRLMATLCEKPRSAGARLVNPMAFAPYLAVAAPSRALILSSGRPVFANGVVLADGRGLAAVETTGRKTHLLSAGEQADDARIELRALLDAFHHNGGGVDQIEIRARPLVDSSVLQTQYSIAGPRAHTRPLRPTV